MTDRKTCECGVSIKDTVKCGFYTPIDKHRYTPKHTYMLELKENDPELWKRVLREGPSVVKVKCQCGYKLYAWSVWKREQSPLHLKLMAKKGLVRDA